jgi:glycosyltransferase involved in cell wall biosynthesis
MGQNFNIDKKFAVLSHILPPSPSGQAIILYRLLSKFNSDRYCLISREKYDKGDYNNTASKFLPCRYYHLKPTFQLPVLNFFKLHIISIMFNTMWAIYRRSIQIKKIIKNENIQILIVCSGDLYDIPAGYLACRSRGIAFVPYLFDDYVYQWMGFYRRVAKLFAKIIMRHSTDIIVPNEFLQQDYLSRYDVTSKVIRNSCSIPEISNRVKHKDIFLNGNINIVYIGAIYHAHYDAFQNLLKAIQIVQRSDMRVHLFTAQDKHILNLQGIDGNMVVFHNHVKQSEIYDILNRADILFLPLAFNTPIPEVIKTSSPGKMGEYLAVGKPILVHAPRNSFVSYYFLKNSCGMVVNENSPDSLSASLAELIENKNLSHELGRTARKCAKRDFDIEYMHAEFIKFINNIKEAKK